jgi:hypothetical protein
VPKKRRTGKRRNQPGLCISPIFASRDVSEMQNSHRGHIGHPHIVSTHR